MADLSFLAFDLGADSGRAMLGRIDEQLTLEEIHRFPNGPVRIGNHIHWDVLRLWTEIQNGLGNAAHSHGVSLAGIGLDTWGVDFGLLDASDQLIGNPFHYRDRRTDGMIEAVESIVTREEIYNQTGIQFMQLNTLFQLFAMRQVHDPALHAARTCLLMPDLFNFWLTGRKTNEYTISTTTQCYNLPERRWASELLTALGIRADIFQEIIQPGRVLEQLRSTVASDVSTERTPVIAVGSHDTASAVAAVPSQTNDFMYISSGTWSLIGIESDEPIVNGDSMKYNLTNEGGVCNTIRFLKNVIGMWLLQEVRREWAKAGKNYSYDDLAHLAAEGPTRRSFIVVGDDRFLARDNMVDRIQTFCLETGQPVPQGDAEVVRCVLESLALEYRREMERLRELSGKTLPVIHIIGGGSRNRLLNQLTAEVTGCEVIAGPVEATAIGNILLQAIALGHLSSLQEGRALVRRSFEVTTYQPNNHSTWDEAYERYLTLRK